MYKLLIQARLRMMTGYDKVVSQWDENVSEDAYFLSNFSWIWFTTIVMQLKI